MSSRQLQGPNHPDKEKGQDLLDKDSKNDESTAVSLSIFQRFKVAYKEYGKTLVAVHVATSVVWYGAFFYAAKR